MKKILLSALLIVFLLSGHLVSASGSDVHLRVLNSGNIIFSGDVALPASGSVNLNDSGGMPHAAPARSVLNLLTLTDAVNSSFNISELQYFSSFSAFYLRCMSVLGGDLCDNWQYRVDGALPEVGMDATVLAGGESVVIYFGEWGSSPDSITYTGGPVMINLNPAPIVFNTGIFPKDSAIILPAPVWGALALEGYSSLFPSPKKIEQKTINQKLKSKHKKSRAAGL